MGRGRGGGGLLPGGLYPPLKSVRGALLDDKTIGCDAETRIGHFTVMEEARLELTLFCPSASSALQHGSFVPHE